MGADKLRKEEYKEYVQSAADLKQGLTGVRFALKILRENSSYQANPAQQAPVAPALRSPAQGAGGGIIEKLEAIESNLGKSLASTKMTEEANLNQRDANRVGHVRREECELNLEQSK